jgi:Thymidylate synthase
METGTLQVTGTNGSAVYLELLEAVLRDGKPVAPRGQPTLELMDVQAVIEDPQEAHVLETGRRPSASITATEAAHLIAGVSSLEQLDLASGGRFSQFADRGRLRGAYGPRAHRQLKRVIRLLSEEPGSRQAVVTIWNGAELSESSRDMPCTLSFQFVIRDGRLLMRTSMRSNDAFLGFPIDIEMFSALQKTVAVALGIPAGAYSHSVGSFHLYERDCDRAGAILDAGFDKRSREPALPDGALPNVDELSPLQRWNSSRQAVEDVIFCRCVCVQTGNASEDEKNNCWRDWQTTLGKSVPPLDNEYQICSSCRYITDGPCRECDIEPSDPAAAT